MSKCIGKTYGRLTVVGKLPSTRFLCICGCGATHIVNGKNLAATKSCGCLVRETLIRRNTKHGLSAKHKRAFHCWNNMVQRCHNPNHPRFSDWGGRGIAVCDHWKENFENFLVDMGDPPEGKEIDRRNNDAGYSKENCRWVTKAINMNNRRNTLNG